MAFWDEMADIPATLPPIEEPPELVPALTDLPGTTPLSATRVQGKLFALTFPQCDVSPAVALAAIIAKPEVAACGIERLVVSQENKDGHIHLHISIALSRSLRYSVNMAHWWDFVCGKHGNYQRTREEWKWVRYIIKDGLLNVKCHPDSFDPTLFVEAASKKQSYNKVIIAKKIVDGERDITQLVKSHAAFVMMNSAKVRSFISICDDADSATTDSLAELVIPIPDVIATRFFNEYEVDVYNWLCSVKSGTFSHAVQHLRIVGSTGIGKTRLQSAVASYLRVYQVPYDGRWMDDFTGNHDLCVFDEFRSQWTIQRMNSFVDGAGVKLSRRGMAPFSHKRRLPCLMLTNYSWIESYPTALGTNADLLATVTRRWRDLVIPHPNTLLHLCSYLENKCVVE